MTPPGRGRSAIRWRLAAGRAIRLWLAVIAAVLVPTGAAAQDTLSRWPGLDVTRLSTVYVLDDAGVETTGKLLRIDPDAVVLLVGGTERRVEAPHVRRIDKRGDSLKNGAWVGAVIGAAFGALGAGLSDCAGANPSGGCAGDRAALFLISTGTYAACGAAIDALVVGRTRLYVAPVRPLSAARGQFRPVQRGVAVTLSFSF